MITLLRSMSMLIKQRLSFASAALSVLLLFSTPEISQAQVIYYLGSDGTYNTYGTNDGIFKVNQDGTGKVRIADGVSSPQDMALDLPNNRAFVTSWSLSSAATATPHGLYRIDLSTGASVRMVATSDAFRISNLAYDPVNDYLYYTAGDGNASTTAAVDGLYRIKGDGTGNIALASAISPTPTFLGIDVPNNKVYIYESVVTAPKLLTFTLNSNSATLLSTRDAARYNGMDYDPINNWLYFTSDNGSTALTEEDGLWRMRPNGSEASKIISNLSPNPNIVTVERVNNVAFVWNSTASDRRIVKVNIANGTSSAFPITPAFNISHQVAAIVIPAASKIATLAGLSISSGTLSPSFSTENTSYTANVVNSVNSLTLTPTKTNAFANIKVNGTDVASGSASGNISLNVGSNTITTLVTAEDGLTTKTYTLTVTRDKTPQTITFNALAAKAYGNADFAPGATSTSALSVSYSSNNTNVATIVNNQIHIVGPGTATITAAQAGDATYLAATSATQTLTVNKGTVTVTAAAATKVYGNTDPAFTYTATGVVGTDAATGVLSREDPNTNKFVGAYAITQGTLSYGDKYNITYVSANLTITKRPFTIRPVGATKVFGDADPNFISFNSDGTTLAPGDGTTGNFARSPGENIGNYATLIGQKRVVSTSTFDDVTNNYNINFISTNTFVITPKQINVTANAATKAFGTADPTFTYVVQEGITDATFTGSLSRTAGEEPGKYALTRGTLAINSNYTFNFISDSLTIGRQTLVLTPNAATKVYGNPDPQYTFSTNVPIVGNSTFTGTPTRAEGANVGTYAINDLGTLGLDNPRYTLSLATGGTLTITKRPLTFNPVPATKSYGNTDPGFPYRFLNGTSVAPGEGITGIFGRAQGENVGVYALTLGTKRPVNITTNEFTWDNYDVTFVSDNLTITPRRLDITATNLSKSFGDEDPSLTYTINQTLVDGDAATGTLARAVGETRAGYPINQGTLSFGNNYQIFFNGGTFTIGKKTIDVAANTLIKTYGATDPEFTYTVSSSPIGENFTGALSRATGENVGTYAILKGTLSLSDNYTLNFTSNDFNINKGTLTYVANQTSKPFYTANPTFTGSVTGFVNGESVATATTGTLAFSTTASLNSPRGSYPITGSGLSATNYDFIQAATNSTALSIVASADNTLASLTASQGTMAPVFDSGQTYYSFNVANNITSFNLSATANSGFATVTINGSPYVSGSTKSLALVAGGNPFEIVVTAQDETIKTYHLHVNRAYSSNNLLSSFVVNGATITPAFDPNITTYHASVPHSMASVSMYGIAVDSTAVVKGYDGTIASAENPFTYELSVGEYAYNLIVTAQNGDNKFYTVVVDRAKSTDATLASFGNELVALNSPIVNGTLNYGGTVEHTTANARFNPVTSSNRASFKVWVNDQPVDSYGGYYMVFGFGTNKLTVEVTSEDGNNTKTYNLNVVREKSNNAMLASLSIPFLNGGLNESFDGEVYAYTATMVDSIYTGLPLKLHAENEFATVKVNGTAVPRFQDYQMALHGGPNTFNIVVASQDGTQTKTYQLIFTRGGTPPPAKSPIARLASLNVSAAPSFSKNFNFSYEELTTVTAPNSVSSVRFFLNKEHPNSTITLNGAAYDAEINESDLYPVAVGDNLFTVVVTAEDGVVTKTYEVHVNRLPYVNVDLSSLSVNKGSLTPVFSAGVTSYTVKVASDVQTINVTAAASTSNNTVVINNEPVDPSNPTVKVTLNRGLNNRIRTVVRSADGITSKTYTINVTHLPSTDATLSSLGTPGTITPKFLSGVTEYKATVGSAVTSLALMPITTDARATVSINGTPYYSGEAVEIPMNIGLNNVSIVVTAENQIATKTYTLKVTRQASSIATASFATSTGTTLVTTTGTGYRNYITSVAISTNSISIKPILTDSSASITINGIAVKSGIYSEPIVLSSNSTMINIKVTAQDATTFKSYTIKVNKAGSNIATTTLSLDTKTALVSTIGPGFKNYQTSISPNTTSVMIRPLLTDSNATVKVNGITVQSGSFSTPVSLNADSTLIDVLVTAQDGVTTKLYTVKVKRGGSNISTASLALSTKTSLISTTGIGYRNYMTSINFNVTSIMVKPVLTDSNATVTVNGILTQSSQFSVPIVLNSSNTMINVVVTAQDGITTKSYTINVKREGANIATASISLDTKTTLVPTIGTGYKNYITSVDPGVGSIMVKPLLTDSNATVTIDGNTVVSGSFSAPISLNSDSTMINVLVTAQDRTTSKLYTINVKREGSNIATASLTLDTKTSLIATSGTGFKNYLTSISFNTSSIMVKPTLTDGNARVTVEGVPVTSGNFSAPILINSNPKMINVVVTAQDGKTSRLYTILVKRDGSNIATAGFAMSTKTALVTTTGTGYRNYKTTVESNISSVMVKSKLTDPNASITINGLATPSEVFSNPINLNADSTMIDIIVTAQDGLKTKRYSIIVKRKVSTAIMVNNSRNENTLNAAENQKDRARAVFVHQGLSPNGDGINDYLLVDGLDQYNDNQISVINSKGGLVYNTKGYGLNGNQFDGHGNNGTMLVQGTYYYILEYKDGKDKIRKTGYIILKY